MTAVEPLESEAAAARRRPRDGGDLAGRRSSQGGAVVTMELDDDGAAAEGGRDLQAAPAPVPRGQPVRRRHARQPGRAGGRPRRHAVPADADSNSVQLDQILTDSFQADTRQDLQIFLDQFGKALIDEGGAESFRDALQDLAGRLQVHLAGQRGGARREPARPLRPDQATSTRWSAASAATSGRCRTLITNLRIVTGSFAAQDEALEQAIIELPQVLEAGDPAFASLNAAFPPLRAFAREVAARRAHGAGDARRRDAAAQAGAAALAAAASCAASPRDLRPGGAGPGASSRKRTPDFLEQARALASCFNNVIMPWSNDEVDGGPRLPATRRPATSTRRPPTASPGSPARAARSDANGQYIRVVARRRHQHGHDARRAAARASPASPSSRIARRRCRPRRLGEDPVPPRTRPARTRSRRTSRATVGPRRRPATSSTPAPMPSKPSGEAGDIVESQLDIEDRSASSREADGLDGKDNARRGASDAEKDVEQQLQEVLREYGG